MVPRIDDLIADVLRREGGFVNHPADRGGPTRFGITQATLSRHLGRPASLDDVQQLPRELAAEIYRREYHAAPRIDALPERIQAFATARSTTGPAGRSGSSSRCATPRASGR